MSELKGSIRSAKTESQSIASDSSHASTDQDFSPSRSERASGLAHGNGEQATSEQDSRKQMRRERRSLRRQQTLAMLPTMLTLGNGVCGMAAIAVATSANLDWSTELKLLVAGMLIFGGMLFDALDGSAARMTGQTSEFGAQLDSLCDAITFGAAPAMILWRFNTGDYVHLKLTWAIGVVFTLCVLIRLARFNAETDEDDDHQGFEGLPSPAAAGTIAAFAIGMYEVASFRTPLVTDTDASIQAANSGGMIGWLADNAMVGFHYLLPALACMLAFLMVSRFNYPHVFSMMVQGNWKPNQIGQLLFIGIVIVYMHSLAIPLLFCYYAFRSPLTTLYQSRFGDPAEAT